MTRHFGGASQTPLLSVLQQIQQPRIATPSELKKDYDPWREKYVSEAFYGLGWRIFNFQGEKMVYHGGALDGASSAIALLPEGKLGIVVLINSHDASPGLISAKFFDLYLNSK